MCVSKWQFVNVCRDLAELNKNLATLQSDREAELRDNETLVVKRMQQEMEKLQQEHEHKMHMRLLQVGWDHEAIEIAIIDLVVTLL